MSHRDLADEIIGRYRDALDRGESVDPEQVIRMHPEIADQLRHRFAALRLLERAFTSARTEPSPTPVARVQPGTRLGPYLLIAELGSGGMGTVYRAITVEDTQAVTEGTEVALKVVHPHLPARRGFLERFHQEVEAGRLVRHRNVVPTFDMGEVQVDGASTLYMSMAYVEGLTLRDLLLDLGRVPEALVREVLRQVADGLSAIHDAGIVHRDLKPENILVTADHEVRISDLGVARLMEASQRLTSVGQFAGSVLYAAPEQFRGEPIRPFTDLYALGVVVYELLSGENPFRRDASMAVMRAHLERRPPTLTDLDLEVSPFLAAVVGRLLAKDPRRRFQSAATLCQVMTTGETSDWWADHESEARRRARRVPRVPVRRETRLHGRSEALDRLNQAWQDARAGRGSALLVVGEAGIGKSRLLDAFLETVDGEDAHVLYGSYTPAYETGAVVRAVLDHFGSADLEAALTPYLAETPGLVRSAVSAVLDRSLDTEDPPLPIESLLAVIADLLRAMAREQPVLWLVDDADLAAASARKVLLAMARALEGHRVLLVLTATPDLDPEMAAALGRLPNSGRIELPRLSPREVVLLLQDALRSNALAERLGVKIAFKSDGVPFFVFEMIRNLKDERVLEEMPDGSFTQSRIVDEIEVPSVVRDLVRVRLAEVSKEERAILDVAAVEGFEFDADLAARVLDRKRVAVLQDLADLERRLGLVRASGRAFRFDHHQIRDVVYEDLAPALRADYHGLLAQAYVERNGSGALSGQGLTFLALHHLHGTTPEAAAPYVSPALEHLGATHRPEAAQEIAQAALAQPGLLHGQARIQVLGNAASACELLGRWDDELAALEEAIQIADQIDDAKRRSALRTSLGDLHVRRIAWDEAREAFQTAHSIARRSGDQTAAMRAETGRAGVLRALGEYDEAEAHFERARSLAREIANRDGEWNALMGLAGIARRRGRVEEANALYERALSMAETLGNDRSISRTCSSYGATLTKLGLHDAAKVQNERAVEISRRIGDRVGEAYAVGSLGNLHVSRGRFDDARACQERALDIAREVGDRRAEATAHANLGMLHLHLDELDLGRAQFEAYRDLSIRLSDPYGESWAALRLGDVEFKSDAPAPAREHFEHALDLARDLGDRWTEGMALGGLGEVLVGLGRAEAARTRLRESRAIARELADRAFEGSTEGALARMYLAVGSNRKALEHAERAMHLASAAADRRGEAFAEYICGVVELREGNSEGAVEHLDLAFDLGAATGSRRRSGWASLRLAEVAQAADQPLKARRLARDALTTGRSVGSPSLETIASCRLAMLPGGDVGEALRTFDAWDAALPIAHRIEALHLLALTTDQRERHEALRRLIECLREGAPASCRASIDQMTAWRTVREALDLDPDG